MLEIFNTMKEFLLGTVNEYIAELAEEADITVPALTENFIVHGVVDMSRYENKVVVSVMEDNQTEDEDQYISSYVYNTDLVVTFLVSGATYDTLVQQTCIYASAFKKAMNADGTFGNGYENSKFQNLKIYYDTGATEKQMTAAEIELTVQTQTD